MRVYPMNEKEFNLSGRLGLSQEELAVKLQLLGLQVGQMAVSRMETGKRIIPDFELPVLAQALGVTTDWLLGQE